MNGRDVVLAAAIAAVVYAFALRMARKAAPAVPPQYVPSGFQWNHLAGAYTKLGNDGLMYRYV